jgi:hypothetical protein
MTPALPFINQRLDDARTPIEDDLFDWLSGKKHPYLEFSGSMVVTYWGPYLDNHARHLTDLAFTTARELANEHSLDPCDTVEDAWNAAESAVNQVIDKMRDYDRKMRIKDSPDSVVIKDVLEIRERHAAAIRKRAENERALMNQRKNTDILLTSEHGFWWFATKCHWTIKIWMLTSFLGLAWTVFQLGLGAGRHNTFLKVHDALKSATDPDSSPEPPLPQHSTSIEP